MILTLFKYKKYCNFLTKKYMVSLLFMMFSLRYLITLFQYYFFIHNLQLSLFRVIIKRGLVCKKSALISVPDQYRWKSVSKSWTIVYGSVLDTNASQNETFVDFFVLDEFYIICVGGVTLCKELYIWYIVIKSLFMLNVLCIQKYQWILKAWWQ